jgi:excisionase family DNA binding protein
MIFSAIGIDMKNGLIKVEADQHKARTGKKKAEFLTRFWDKRELAEYLGLSVFTIDAWVSQRRIPFVKIGGRKVMFDKKEIETWIDGQRIDLV